MKNKPEDNERNFFQNRFDDFASEPSDAVWSQIANELPQPTVRSRFLRKRWLLAAALVVSTGTLGWWAMHTPEAVSDAQTRHVQTATTSGKPPVEETPDHTTASKTTTTHEPAPSDEVQNSIFLKHKTQPLVSANVETNPSRRRLAALDSVNRPDFPTSDKELANALMPRSEKGKHAQQSIVLRQDETFAETTEPRSEKYSPTAQESFNETPSDFAGLPASETPSVNGWLISENSIFQTLKTRPIVARENPLITKTLVFKPLPLKPLIQPQKAKTPRHVSIYASFTHWMNYYAVTPVITDSVFVNQVDVGKPLSAQRSGWQWQAGIVYPLRERLSLRVGVFYYRQTQQVSYQTQSLYPETSVVTPNGASEVKVSHKYHTSSETLVNQQQNMGLRADALYQLGRLGAFHQYASGGLQSALIRFNEQSAAINTDIQVGYGVARPLSRQVAIWIEPTFRYSLNNRLDASRYTRIRPYYFGLSAGMNFQWK